MNSTGQPPCGALSTLKPGGVHTRSTFSSFHLRGGAGSEVGVEVEVEAGGQT